MLASLVLVALTATPPLTVRIVSGVGGAVPDGTEKRVRAGTQVALYALAWSGQGLVGEAPQVVWEGRVARPRAPTAADGALRVRWWKVEAAARSVSNTDPTFHWEPIPYQDVPLPACDDKLVCPADLRATLLGDRGGLGTMAFKVEVRLGDRVGASPGSERLYRGGLAADVARVTVRRDDTYLGYLTELFNTPYIWGSAGDPATVHQAERRIGSDCADFVTYGVRRLGHDVPYTSTYGLPKYGRTLFESAGPGPDGVYLAAGTGKPIPVGERGLRPGDLLLFPRHVGAFVRDEPPLGVLSTSDVMIHTCWAEPAEQPLASTDYGATSVKVLRWRVLESRATR